MGFVLGQYVPAGSNVTWFVDGRERLARVVSPTVFSSHPPLVLCFHGGGGQAYYAVDEYGVQKYWPEAAVYYAQGLNSKGGFTSWSKSDFPFFRQMVHDAAIRFHADPKRVFILGYSTGANFAADLWSVFGSQLAGFVLVSGGRYKPNWSPRPVFLSFGIQESEAGRLEALGKTLAKDYGYRQIQYRIDARRDGHTYPQYRDHDFVEFLRNCPAIR